MPASPFSAISSIFGFLKPYALEVFCALCIFLWSSQVVACAIFVTLLSAMDFFILSVSKCGCFGSENGRTFMYLHRSDGHCEYYGKKPVPITYGLAVFLNQNYNAYVVVLAVCVSYYF
jgi:hypothetical protein